MTAEQRRAELIETAGQLFSRRSYGGTAMRDIARALGVNQALIYQHFQTKEALLEASMVRPTDAIRQLSFVRLERLAEAALLGDEVAIRRYNRELFDALTQTLPFFGSVVYGDPILAPTYFRRYWRKPFDRTMDEILRFAELNSLNLPRDTARNLLLAIYGANLGGVIHLAFGGRGIRPADFSNKLATLLAHGLLFHGESELPELLRISTMPSGNEVSSSTGRETQSDPRGSANRAALLASARTLFTARGKAKAQVGAIARAAGVTEPTLYRHFGSKEALFEAAMLEPLETVVADIVRIGSNFRNIESADRLPLGIQINEDMSQAFREITSLLAVALFSDRDDGEVFYQTAVVPTLSHVADAIRQNMTDVARSRMSATTLVQIMIGMHFSAASVILYDKEPIDDRTLALTFSYIISFGVPSLLRQESVAMAQSPTSPASGSTMSDLREAATIRR
jgi:AcrR family transcriptional regulator